MLAAATLLAYATVLSAPFVSDDLGLVAEVAARGPFGVWSGVPRDFLRPVVSLSLWLDHAVHGLRPLGFHLTNVLVHLAAALLLARVVHRWAIELAPRAAPVSEVAARGLGLFAGAVFALLPCHAESVSWISGRTDVLAAAFGLGAIERYGAARASGRALPLAAAAGLFGLGLLSKESVLTLPGILAAYEVVAARGRLDRRAVARLALFTAVLVPYLALRRAALGTFVGGYAGMNHLAIGASAPKVVENGAVRVLFPWLPRRALDPRFRGLVANAWAAVLGVALAAAIRRGRHRKLLALAAVAFPIALLPAATLWISLETTDGERFAYLASAFGAIVLAIAASALPWARVRSAVQAGFLVSLAAGLLHANAAWRDAGAIARQVREDAVALAAGRPLVVLNLPDDLRQAYVYRNGFAAAVRLEGGERAPALRWVAAFHVLARADEPVALARDGDAFELRLAPPGRFMADPGAVLGGPDGWEARVVARDRARVRAGRGGEVVLYYSAGRLHPVTP